MAVSEKDRHELYQELERKTGKGPTETMMALLPPVGWADVATKHDLAALADRLEAVEARLETKIEAAEARTSARILKTALVVNNPTILSAVALSFTAARLGS